MKQTKTNKLGKLAMAGIIAGTAVIAGFAGAYVFPNEVSVPVLDEAAYAAALAEGAASVVIPECPACVCEPEVINNTVTEYVEVDNGNLDLVLDTIYDNDGKVEFLVDDLDDDELNQIVDRIAFVNDAKAMAIAEVKKELFDEADDMVIGTVILDDDDMERLKIDDDADELLVENADFEDKDVDIRVFGTFEQNNVEYDFEVLVEIKDGEVEDFNIVSITEAI